MSMTRTDFKAIAEILRLHKLESPESVHIILLLADDLAKYFKKANPTFDRGKFLRAAGWYQE